MKMKKLLMMILPMLSLPAFAADVMIWDYNEGICRFNKSIIVDENDWEGGHSQKLANGGSAKISKTDAQGRTKIVYTFYVQTYDESQVPKGEWRTVEYFGRIPTSSEDFEYNGVKYNHAIDGCVCEMGRHAGVYFADGNGNLHLYNFLLNDGGSNDLNVPTEWRKTRTLLGLYGERCGDSVEGTVQVKCGKANKKGIAKVSMTISPFNGKKVTYRSTSVDVSRGGGLRVVWPNQKYFVEISGDEFFGEPIYGDPRPACSPNSVWSADVGGRIPDGNWYAFGSDYAFRFWRRNEEWAWQLEDLFDDGRYCINLKLAMPLLTGQTFAVRNGKIDFGKKPSLKYKEIGGSPVLVGLDAAKPNIPGTKITYNAKTGVLKGSFVVYTDPHVCYAYDGKLLQLKKHSFKMAGVVLKGNPVGKGVATCKKPAYSCPMTLYRTDVTY